MNNLIDDNNKICLTDAQKLTAVDVKNLKEQGANPDDLIAELAKNNKNFEHRTKFSKEKYLAKKKKKHSNVICIFKPTVRLLAHVYFHKDTDKVCGLRVDNLALILSYANVCCGSKVLVVENCAGLVTGGVLERLNGRGTCIHFHRNDQAQGIPALNAMNFSDEQMSSFYPISFKHLIDELDPPNGQNSASQKFHQVDDDLPDDGNFDHDDLIGKGKRRKRNSSSKSGDKQIFKEKIMERRSSLRAKRQEALKMYDQSTFDSLIIACKQHPLDFLKHLIKKVEPSSPLVIYSLHARLLLDCYTWLRERDIAINLKLSENFYRVHQVLPGRTHPEMNQLVVGGFLLTGVVVEN